MASTKDDISDWDGSILWVIGLLGPVMVVIPVYLIKIAELRIEEMYEKKNISVNILNDWIYRFIILSLKLQVVISVLSTFIILFCQID